MDKKITLAQADKQKPTKKKKGSIAKALPQRNPHMSETERTIVKTIEEAKKQGKQLVSDEERKQPLHVIIQKYQLLAFKTLVDLMENSSSDSVKLRASNDVLSLGGNSSDMLKLQAVMTGRSKDISQMSADELESFIKNAKDSLQTRIEESAQNAQNITPNGKNSNPTGGVSTILGGDYSEESEGDAWL